MAAAEQIYAVLESGADFSIAQDLGPKHYEEQYYHPDCALLYPARREAFWFDLTHLSLGPRADDPARRYIAWNLSRKKFAFSVRRNTLSLLIYPYGHTRALSSHPPVAQPSRSLHYLVGNRYEPLCEGGPEGVSDEDLGRLDTAWAAHEKLKMGVRIGKSLLIYPIRLAYRTGDVFSFASKEVVIPDPEAETFSWDRASIGRVCVSSSGLCSMCRYPKQGGHRVLRALFDGSWLSRRNLAGLPRMLSRIVQPAEVEDIQCSFTIYREVGAQPAAVELITQS